MNLFHAFLLGNHSGMTDIIPVSVHRAFAHRYKLFASPLDDANVLILVIVQLGTLVSFVSFSIGKI